MSDPSAHWPPSTAGPGTASTPLFDSSVPLGGVSPVAEEVQSGMVWRHLALALFLFIAAVVAGRASGMPWRDYMWNRADGVIETGWTRQGGTLGRGWLTMLCAIALAASGLLIAAYREWVGRILAVASGTALMLLATIEWGIGHAGTRDGPGIGLWIQLLTGAAAILAVGMVPPSGAHRPE